MERATPTVSPDLSGPHPKAVGTGYTYLFVAVLHTEKTNLVFVRGLNQNSKRSGRSLPLCVS
eukprot:6157410-Prorocentrum_lima.AAC.1